MRRAGEINFKMNVEKKWRADEVGRDEPDPSRRQKLRRDISQLWQGARRRNHL